MKKLFILFIISFLVISTSQAQFTRYIVRLKDKGATTFTLANPSAYLTQRAVDRRTRYSIAVDSSDIPVPSSYVTQIKNIPNVTILNVSKWLNAVDIQTSDANAITAINALPFVQNTSPLAARTTGTDGGKFRNEDGTTTGPITSRIEGIQGDFFNYGTASYNEIHLHKGEFLHNIGLRGQGMQIAMLDAGYFNYTTLKAFDSARINGQILSTWDFVNREASVVEDYLHGMQCLSTIAANIPGQFVGKAPKASFHLFRTEDVSTEYPIEEFNWVCGAERADSLGSDIISSSLGYNTFDNATFNHTYSQMNGNTTMCTIGADLAAKKGIIVFNSAGNEGTDPWHFLVAPSDGDSVVAVGAVNAAGNVGSFSSYGPSADGRIKPDVASVGAPALVQATNNTVGSSNGTSFACPNMAGLGSCLWQGFPEFNNMRIVRALKEAGSTFASPNDRIGYGIPDMKAAFSALLIEFATSTSTMDTCTATIRWTSKDVAAMKYEIEGKLPGQSVYTKIGELFPQPGDLLSNHNYQFNNTIVNSPAGSVSYRIRQIIDTSSISFTAVYIDTTAVNIAANCFTDLVVNTMITSATLDNNCVATVNWTSKDNGTMRYEVERKLPGETAFTKVGDVPAQPGNAIARHSYSFNNALINSPAGLVNYRIRQVIDTSAASFAALYLQVIAIGIPGSCFPNYLINHATSSATINGCTATVNWSSTDHGAMRYEVERKMPGELNYTKISDVPSQPGLAAAVHSYSFADANINSSPGVISYRIRQIIDTFTATFAAVYIDTANVTLTSVCGNATGTGDVFRVVPSPTISNASLIVQTSNAITNMPINIHDMKGRLVMRLNKSKGPGKITINLPVDALASGKYVVKIYDGNKEIGSAEFMKL